MQSGSEPSEVLSSMQDLINSLGSMMEVTGKRGATYRKKLILFSGLRFEEGQMDSKRSSSRYKSGGNRYEW